ncbi:hypothetical protein D3C83_312160 [compost metagenome]
MVSFQITEREFEELCHRIREPSVPSREAEWTNRVVTQLIDAAFGERRLSTTEIATAATR